MYGLFLWTRVWDGDPAPMDSSSQNSDNLSNSINLDMNSQDDTDTGIIFAPN
jgi:hypothetical protein